ncbi:hypothetical protein DL95DRAFT_454465 [Leptodontidium sp. 2 PMI_412]|nr:hypothetical protein DL95DRAFT_454465 [Leptodontidium sp. 2 PMI_412]
MSSSVPGNPPTAIENPQENAINHSPSSVPLNQVPFNRPAPLLQASHRPEYEPPFGPPTHDPAIPDDGAISARMESGMLSPETSQDTPDFELLVPGILEAEGRQGKSIGALSKDPGQHGYQQASATTAHYKSSVPAQQAMSPMQPPTMSQAMPARIIGIHTFGHPAHCCGFDALSQVSGLSGIRFRLLLWAANLSQWTQFEALDVKKISLPLSPGQWIYEVDQFYRTRDPMAPVPWEFKDRRYFYGGALGSAPHVLFNSQLHRWFKGGLFLYREALIIRCEIFGHAQMCIKVWMSDEDLSRCAVWLSA